MRKINKYYQKKERKKRKKKKLRTWDLQTEK